MIYIADLDSQRFTFNGIPFYKNFMPFPIGDRLKIVNTYDSKVQLCEFTRFEDFSVDGVTYSDVANLQQALLPVLYTRESLGGPISSTPLFNKFLVVNGYNVAGANLTVNAGWQWLINGALYSNTSAVLFEIPLAAEGKTRIDLIVANTSGTFVRIPGVEAAENPTPPPLPANRLQATFILVTEDSISEPTTPSSGQYLGLFDSVSGFETAMESSPNRPTHGSFAFVGNGASLWIGMYVEDQFFYIPWVFSMQQMYNINPENLDVTDGDSTTKIRPTHVETPRLELFDPVNGDVGTYLESDDTALMVRSPFNSGEIQISVANGAIAANKADGGSWIIGPAVGHTGAISMKIPKSTTPYPGVQMTMVRSVNGETADEFGAITIDIPDYNPLYKGKYTTLANLQTAHPTGEDGWSAIVDAGAGSLAKEYIWDAEDGWVLSGSVGPSTTDALAEGSSNLYFTSARVRSAELTGISFVTGGLITAADTILQAFGKLQNQVSDIKATTSRILYKSSAYGSVIATTTQTTIHTFNIAAGTTAADTQLELILNFARTGVAGSVTINVYLNSISTPTQLGQCLYGAGANRQIPFERTFNIQGATIDQADRLNNIISDKTAGSTNRSTIAYNPAVLNQIIVTVTVSNAADNVYPAPYSLTQY